VVTSPNTISYCCSGLEKPWVVVLESSSDTERICAFSFQHRFTISCVRDIVKFIIHGCANRFVYFV